MRAEGVVGDPKFARPLKGCDVILVGSGILEAPMDALRNFAACCVRHGMASDVRGGTYAAWPDNCQRVC